MKKITSAIILTAVLLTCTACSNNETVGNEISNTNSSSSLTGEQSTTNNDSNKEQNSLNNSTSQSDASTPNSDKPTAPTVPTDLKPSEGLEFESNGDGTCTLVKIGTCTDKDIVIPEKKSCRR